MKHKWAISLIIVGIVGVSAYLLKPMILYKLGYSGDSDTCYSKWNCANTYADGGKICRDSSECEGECVYDGSGTEEENRLYDDWMAAGSPNDRLQISGRCEEDDYLFTCQVEVKDGFIEHGITCLDP